jgi:Bacterial RNA polymerase, alpha chain C terminal domain
MSDRPAATNNVKQAGRLAQEKALAAYDGCPACNATGYDDGDECCPRCHGTGEYSGIPDAWGRYGVEDVYLATDSETTSEQPGRLVRLATSSCETALTVKGAEDLAARLHAAVRELTRQEAEANLAAALARGEQRLQSIREELGARAFNCLAREGVLTIEQAAAMTDEEMLGIVNLGVSTLEHIRVVVAHASRPAASPPS